MEIHQNPSVIFIRVSSEMISEAFDLKAFFEREKELYTKLGKTVILRIEYLFVYFFFLFLLLYFSFLFFSFIYSLSSIFLFFSFSLTDLFVTCFMHLTYTLDFHKIIQSILLLSLFCIHSA